jgi:SAM-dependent methyltransferase
MNDLLAPIASYYTDKLRQFGDVPRGVDWNGLESQALRFAQLCSVLPHDTPFSIADIGCGYGALLDFLEQRFKAQMPGCEYVGVDISDAMLEAAARRHANKPYAQFVRGMRAPQSTDFAVASGIFNVRLSSSDDAWHTYIRESLTIMHASTTKGFAFNCLTSYSDRDKMRPDLYYADPCELFDFCKRTFARNVALLHDYGLYEFTILVRK